MKFLSHGRHYEIDEIGVIHQTDVLPYTYTAQYSATYDKPEYKSKAEVLNSLRLSFAVSSHGNLYQCNSLTDLGYGNGSFMLMARKIFPVVYGVDVTGVKVDGCHIVDKIPECDVLTMWDVLEHIPDLSFLKTLPCKTLVVSVPYCHLVELGNAGADWFDNIYHHRKPDEHIHHFDKQSLACLMKINGWSFCANSNHEDIVRIPRDKTQNIISMSFKRSSECIL